METLQKRSLFWDVADVHPERDKYFIIERILAFGDEDDFKWARNFYGEKEIKKQILRARALNKRSLFFWCQYFNINPAKCIQKQLARKPETSWQN